MIRLDNVTKRYGAFTALDSVSFEARQGEVTGFLGPNGAGKSTAMRVLTGLTHATSGAATIDGRPYTSLGNPGRAVGVLLDASAQHGGRRGREVLTLAALSMGLPAASAGDMMERVGLSEAEGKRRVKDYSLGMRQRLGIAQALLGDPQVLVLDEPANGLDPAGIHWMRELLRWYAGRGGTVLLSSHLLHEVELIADRLVMIGQGRIVASGTAAELAQAGGALVAGEDSAALAAALTTAGLTHEPSGDGFAVSAEPLEVGRAAASAGVVLSDLRPGEGASLEAMFLKLTRETAREEVAT